MRLVIIGTEKQVLEYKNERESEDLIIPTGPWAMYYADIYGWKTISFGSLWTDAEYSDNEKESLKRINCLISQLNAFSSQMDIDAGLEIGNYFAFQIWVIIGQIHRNYFLLEAIRHKINPEKVLVYTSKSEKIFMELRPDPDRILADIILQSNLFDPDILVLKEVQENNKPLSYKSRILQRLPEGIVKLLQELRKKRMLSRYQNTDGLQLLIVGAGYDWIKIPKYECFNKSFGLNYLIPPIFYRKIKSPSSIREILSSSITYNGRPVYDLTTFADNIYTTFVLFLKSRNNIQKRLQKCYALVASVLVFPWENFLAHMAIQINKPVVLWQHGEKGSFPDVTIPFTEINFVTHYLCYGQAVRDKEYKKYVENHKLRVVEPIGSLGKKIDWRGGKKIVYATGKWLKTASPFLGTRDLDNKLYFTQKTILKYLNSVNSDYSPIFKANNSPGLNEVPHSFPKVKVDYFTPFTELLTSAGIIILDTPGTTLVEACTTKVPIFVVGGSFNYYSEFIEMVSKRVIWCESADDLIVKLDQFLKSGLYEANVENEEYLNSYFANHDADQVANSVVSVLMKVNDMNAE